MTINQLIKRLEKLRDTHGKTIRVHADVDALRRSVNDAWNAIEVEDVDFALINVVDGDGFTEYDRRGAEKQLRCILLQ